MESTDATTASAAADTDGIQHDATTNDATADDATTKDTDSATATDENESDVDVPNTIWITTTATTLENDVTVRGGEYM